MPTLQASVRLKGVQYAFPRSDSTAVNRYPSSNIAIVIGVLQFLVQLRLFDGIAVLEPKHLVDRKWLPAIYHIAESDVQD